MAAGGIGLQDAMRVFSLSPGFGASELRSSYIRLAKRVHPEHGGRDDLFATVNECYHVLLWDVRSRTQAPALHHDLRESFREHRDPLPARGELRGESRGFDAARFNALFEEFHMQDPVEAGGHADVMAADGDAMPELDPGSCTADRFNRAFEEHVPPEDSGSRVLVVRPHPGNTGSSLTPSELGLDHIETYEVWLGGIGAYDCKMAYTARRPSAHGVRQADAAISSFNVDALLRGREDDLRQGVSAEQSEAYRSHEQAARRMDDLRASVQLDRDNAMRKRCASAFALMPSP
jgi:hypothetical protein